MTKICTPKPLVAASEADRLVRPAGPHDHHQRKHRKIISPAEARKRSAEREEMNSLLAKLQQLVPGIPKNRRLSTLEIIQHVIDYIFDLQVALETHPISADAAGMTTLDGDNVDFFNELAANTARLCQMTDVGGDANNVTCQLMSTLASTGNAHLPATQRIPSHKRQPLASITL